MVPKFIVDFFAPEIRSWSGEQRLWVVFWGYGVAASVVIGALYGVAISADGLAFQQILLLLFAAYTAWILVSVWRCADNTRDKHWGLIARFLTAGWAANAFMLFAFLQLDLGTKYFGR